MADEHIPPSLRLIIGRKEMLRTNSGKEIDELIFAPFKIGAEGVDVQDGGQAVIIEIDTNGGDKNGIFVRLQSCDTEMQHDLIRAFIGKRVEVSIKVVGED